MSIELVNVSKAFGETQVLRGLSERFAQGEAVCVMGRSGLGKTTLASIVMGLEKPDAGAVQVSGRDVSDIDTADLRALEAYVTQDTHLFRDSIRENLRIAKPDATDAEIEEACRKASVHEFIRTLPTEHLRAWLDDWVQDKPLKRAYTIITALWIGVFSLRLLVQVPLYLTDQVGWLGTARLLMGIPFWALMIWISYLIIATPMHHHKALHAAAEEQPDEREPQRPDA